MQFTFGRQLASVEKKVRDAALDELKSKLALETELSEIDFLKLWKALFYCYWLSDKSDAQLDLAEKISLISLELSPQMGLEYIRYFWQTIIKEWHGIDKFRMDKYYSLLRHIHFVSFKLLENNNWDTELLSVFTQILHQGPLNPTSISTPDGLRLHTLEVYMPILVATVSEIPNHAWPYLLDSMVKFIAFTNQRHLVPSFHRFFKHECILNLVKDLDICKLMLERFEPLTLNEAISKKSLSNLTSLLLPFKKCNNIDNLSE